MNDNVIGIENTKSEKDNYLCPCCVELRFTFSFCTFLVLFTIQIHSTRSILFLCSNTINSLLLKFIRHLRGTIKDNYIDLCREMFTTIAKNVLGRGQQSLEIGKRFMSSAKTWNVYLSGKLGMVYLLCRSSKCADAKLIISLYR